MPNASSPNRPDKDPPPSPDDPGVGAFLRDAAILIVDQSSSSRPAIRKLVSALGAKTANVDVVEDFESAEETVRSRKPTVVFADFNLGKRNAIDLFQAHNQAVPDRLKSVFIVLSQDRSPATTAALAEADIDALLVRPLTYNDLQAKFLEALGPKLAPSLFLRLLEAGRRFLDRGQPEHAIQAIKEAHIHDPGAPAACFLEGVARKAQGDLEGAVAAFEAGLRRDRSHYRCLLGLYEAHLEAKRFDKAYAASAAFSEFYPVNPKRIPELVRLCILNEKYADILALHEALSQVDQPDDALTRHIAAGLVTAGKWFIKRGEKESALLAFKKAELSSRAKPAVLKEVVAALYGAGFESEAKEILKRVPPEVASAPAVVLAVLDSLHARGPSADTFRYAQDLVAQGVRAPRLYVVLIAQAKGLNRPAHVLQDYAWRAGAEFPDHREHFLSLIE